MTISPLNNCTAAKIMAKQTPLYLVKLAQAIICMLTVTLVVLTVRPMLKTTPKVGLFHPNLRVIGLSSLVE